MKSPLPRRTVGRCLPARPGRGAALRACVPIGTALLAGCASVQSQTPRAVPSDDRIVLDWNDRVSVYSRDLPNYICTATYVLSCERAGSITYSCTCVLR